MASNRRRGNRLLASAICLWLCLRISVPIRMLSPPSYYKSIEEFQKDDSDESVCFEPPKKKAKQVSPRAGKSKEERSDVAYDIILGDDNNSIIHMPKKDVNIYLGDQLQMHCKLYRNKPYIQIKKEKDEAYKGLTFPVEALKAVKKGVDYMISFLKMDAK